MNRRLHLSVSGAVRLLRVLLLASVCCLAFGCGADSPDPSTTSLPEYPNDNGYVSGAQPASISFQDEVASQPDREEKLTDFRLVDPDGNEHRLGDISSRKNTVVVVLRGYAGILCLYCTTQTSRLIASYEEFRRRDAEVIVIFPVMVEKDASHFQRLLDSAKSQLEATDTEVPFPVLLDVELSMVDGLGIRQALSLPATYILDDKDQVRFAYVGSSIADRPSIKAMLAELDRLNGGPPAAEVEGQTGTDEVKDEGGKVQEPEGP